MTPVTLEKGEDCPQDQSQGTSSRKPSRYSQAHLLSPGSPPDFPRHTSSPQAPVTRTVICLSET